MSKLKLTNAAGDRPELWVYEDIGGFFGGITSNDMRMALSEVNDTATLDVHINSGGGDYFEGIAMHTLLTQRKGKVNVYVDGLAASAASIIAMAGSSITMAAGSQMMIHEVRAGFHGTAGEFRRIADTIDISNADAMRIYMRRWKGSEGELRKALADETWMNADAAVSAGLADSQVASRVQAASVDISKFHYRNIPATFSVHCDLKSFESRLFETFPELKEKVSNG